MTDASTLYVSLELVGSTGRRWHTSALLYTGGETVHSIVKQMCHTPCNYLEFAYGVKRIEPGVEWTIRPSRLKWVVNKPWRAGMTMQELFHNVPKAENERYYLVMSRLDLKTKPTDPIGVVALPNAVYWLKDLYVDINGKLRDLKALADRP